MELQCMFHTSVLSIRFSLEKGIHMGTGYIVLIVECLVQANPNNQAVPNFGDPFTGCNYAH